MLTGLYSPRHGVRSIGAHRLHPHVATLPGVLAAAGYHTIAEVTGPLGTENGLADSDHPWMGNEIGKTADVFRVNFHVMAL